MFELKHLAKMFSGFTDWDFVIGGVRFSPNFVRGAIICSPISTSSETSQTKRHAQKTGDDDTLQISETSFIRYTLQLDFYKQNDDTATEIQALSEAIKTREWLKSWQVSEYLADINAEILPNYSIIQNVVEMIDNKPINRAFFTFDIISQVEISESDKYADTTAIKGGVI